MCNIDVAGVSRVDEPSVLWKVYRFFFGLLVSFKLFLIYFMNCGCFVCKFRFSYSFQLRLNAYVL